MRLFILVILSFLSFGSATSGEKVRPIERIAPAYPEDARKNEISGRVRGILSVDERGHVTDVEVTSESPKGFGFGEAAREAFLQWIYPPKAPGKYSAVFTFAMIDLSLTAEEAELDFAGPPIDKERIRYPSRAMDAGLSGNVELVAIIDTAGNVESVRALKESPAGVGFKESAENALKKYRFAPGPRSIWTMTIKFRMDTGSDAPLEIALPAGDLPDAPEPRRAGRPDYPYEARKAGIEGVVELAIQIDKRGQISHAGVLREEPTGQEFAVNAMKALGEWRFSGSERGTYRLKIEFKLND